MTTTGSKTTALGERGNYVKFELPGPPKPPFTTTSKIFGVGERMNCVKSGCYQFSQHWNYNNCELRPHSKAKRIVVGEMQMINSDSALHQIPQRDHKTRRTIAESLRYMPMLLPTLLATAGPVWDLGLLPSDSLRDPSSVQRAGACHKLFHNVRTGLVMEQMNI